MMMSHLHSCFNQRLFSIHPTKHTVRLFVNYDLLTDYHGARLIYRGTSTSGLCNTTGIRAASRIYRCGLSPSLGPHLRTWPSCRVQSSTHLKGEGALPHASDTKASGTPAASDMQTHESDTVGSDEVRGRSRSPVRLARSRTVDSGHEHTRGSLNMSKRQRLE